MTLEEGIRTSLDYENRIRDLYAAAAKRTRDDAGRGIFETLADEENGHVLYLEGRLREWHRNGRVTVESLGTAIPAKERIAEGLDRVRARAKSHKREPHNTADLEMLRKALQMEVETAAFYRQLVRDLPAGQRGLFDRFVQIEDGHVAIVQAEIDSLTELGFWFDSREFDLEAG